MQGDDHFHLLKYELRGGPLDGATYEHGQGPRSDDPDTGTPYFESGIWRLKGKNGETLGHRYDRTDEHTPNDFRVYRYAGVVPLPTN